MYVLLDKAFNFTIIPQTSGYLILQLLNLLQGDPNQHSPFLRVITEKLSISVPKLVKPKCIRERR